MKGIRLTDDDTLIYFRSDSLNRNDVLDLGYVLDNLRTDVDEEGLDVISLLHAIGYGELASELVAEATDWRWMTDAEIEAYERCPLNHGAIATLIPMPSDFQQGLVEAEVLKGRVATLAAAPVDLATALEAMAKGTVVTFQDAAQDQPDERNFSLDAFRESIKFNFSMHHTPVAMSHEGEAALAALVGAAKEHLRRDDSCWTFAKAGELKASAPNTSVEFIDMGDLTDEENEIITSFAGKLQETIFDFAAQARCSGNENNPRLLYVLMFKFLEAAAAAHLTVAEDDEQPASLEAFHANATQSWMKVKAMGATS